MKLRRSKQELITGPMATEATQAEVCKKRTPYDYRAVVSEEVMSAIKRSLLELQGAGYMGFGGTDAMEERDILQQVQAIQQEICILFPERMNEFNISQNLFRRVMIELQNVKDCGSDTSYRVAKGRLDSLYNRKMWLSYFTNYCDMVFKYPDRIADFKADDIVFGILEKLLQENRESGDWSRYLTTVKHLAVAHADEIEVTDQGVKFITHQDDLDQVSSLPSRNLAA